MSEPPLFELLLLYTYTAPAGAAIVLLITVDSPRTAVFDIGSHGECALTECDAEAESITESGIRRFHIRVLCPHATTSDEDIHGIKILN
jgi:hypothetical protein